jgi:hypothetical protein
MAQESARIGLLVAGGGFYGELRGLLPKLETARPRLMLIPDTGWSLAGDFPDDLCVKTPSLIRSRAEGVRRSPGFLLGVIGQYRRILLRERPTAVVALGSVDTMPLAIAARLAGIPLVFIESITRVSDLSTTGKWVYRLRLARRFYVQWPRLAALYPRAVYRGIVHDLRDRRDDPL